MKEFIHWTNRCMVIAILVLSCVFLGGTAQRAYAAEITMGSGGNLIFEPSEITIKAGDTITFVNGELPPHNMIVKDHPELSHSDLKLLWVGKVSRLLSQNLESMSFNVILMQVQE